MGRIMAIDYGQKRVGIAVSDENQLIAGALTTIASAQVMDFLQKYTSQEVVDLFVVGEPKQTNNEASQSTKYIEPFLKQLKKMFPTIPIVRIDERFTSKIAFQTMIDAGLSKKARQNKALVDSISATLILQSYMQSIDLRKERNKI